MGNVGSSQINEGQSVKLSYTGCANGVVKWNDAVGSGNNISVSPTQTTVYTATCSGLGGSTCSLSLTVNVKICQFKLSSADASINLGNSTTLSYTGCDNGQVVWANGVGTGNDIKVSPSQTTKYTAICKNNWSGKDCEADVLVTVIPCDFKIKTNFAEIKSGQSAMLSYEGCIGGTVSWNAGLGTGNNIVVAPTQTINYVGVCTPKGGGVDCSDLLTLVVTGECKLRASATATTIIVGESTTLLATGCDGKLIWANNLGVSSGIEVKPTETTQYEVTCKQTSGTNFCTSTITITVFKCEISASVDKNSIDEGETVQLSATGCLNGTITWLDNKGALNTTLVAPKENTTFKAICTIKGSTSFCSSSVSVTVKSCELTLFATAQKIVFGESSTLSFTGCNNGSVTWDNGIDKNLTVKPLQTTTYTATCKNTISGTVACVRTITIVVIPACKIEITANKQVITSGESVTLTSNSCEGTVSWSDGLGDGISKTVSPLLSKTYTASCNIIGNSKICFASIDIEVKSSPISIVEITPKNVTCQGLSNGSFTIVLNRAKAINETDLSVKIFAGNQLIETYPLNEGKSIVTKPTLKPDNYVIIVETSVGNTIAVSAQSTAIIKAADAISFNLSATNVNCFSGKDGTILVEASGGKAPFQYQLNGNGAFVQFSETNQSRIQNLVIGDYMVLVKDANNCAATLSKSVKITQPNTVVGLSKISQTDPTSFEANDGIAVVKASGGTPNYTFKWTDANGKEVGVGTNLNDVNTINTLAKGVYVVSVFDVNYSKAIQKETCTAKFEVSIASPPKLEAIIVVEKNASCFGWADAKVALTISGGVPFTTARKYDTKITQIGGTLTWTNTTVLNNFPAGKFLLVVKDKNGTSKEFTFTVFEPAQIQAKIANINAITCAGSKNGALDLSVSGGASPYKTSWNLNQTGFALRNLGVGNYKCVVFDSKGCESNIVTASIIEPKKITIDFKTNKVNCADKCDGSAEAIITGGTGDLSFTWKGRTENTLLLNSLCGAEDLTLIVKDANSCTAQNSVSLVKPVSFSVKLDKEKTVCSGLSTILDATNPLAKSYLWKTPAGTSQTTPTITAKETGVYSVTAKNENGCEATAETALKVNTIPTKVDFLVASAVNAEEPFVIVNRIDPLPKIVDWLLPSEALNVKKSNLSAELMLKDEGDYSVGIKATFDLCEAVLKKNIKVLPKALRKIGNVFINEVKISNNPNQGNFTAIVNLKEDSPVKIEVVPIDNIDNALFKYASTGGTFFEIPVDLGNVKAGVYLLRVQTQKEILTTRIVVVN